MPKNTKAVTIVVPVYGDWPSLDLCIQSLKQHVSSEHTVIFVNDCGPEADRMEHNITQHITGLKNFRYFRNPHNLGFVGTCNRGVELDTTDNDILLLNSDTEVTAGFLEEMQRVLYAHPSHGCVCPRSSNATIATIPFVTKNPIEDRDHVRAKAVYDAVRDKLPAYSISPTAMGFCILIRRDLIRQFGLFDTAYGSGYGEENDFCMRINQHGYSALIANHAFVYHYESRSFTSKRRIELIAKNEKILLQRYPYYYQWVDRYINERIHPVDHFADLIAGSAETPKVLIHINKLPESAASVQDFTKVIRQLKIKKEWLYSTDTAAATKWGVNVTRHTDLHHPGGLFEAVLVIGFPQTYLQLQLLNKCAMNHYLFSDETQLLRHGQNITAQPELVAAAEFTSRFANGMFFTADALANFTAYFHGRQDLLANTKTDLKGIAVPDIELLKNRWFAASTLQPQQTANRQPNALKRRIPRPIKRVIKRSIGR